MLAYIFDFLSVLFDKLKEKDKVRNIILFGSFARGNPRKDSDIDLFIDVLKEDKEQIEQIVKETINEFELKAQKSWRLKGITNAITPIVGDIGSAQWKELRREISSYGIVLYGKYHAESEKSRHFVLIEYNLSKLRQRNKMQVIRALQGYRLKKGNKFYEQKGLIDKLGAEKIENAVIIDISSYKQIFTLLKENKVPVKIKDFYS